MSLPTEIQKILEYLDKGMTISEYAELNGIDETELKLKIAEKVPRKTYYKIRKVYFENDDEEELVGATAWKLQKFNSGRYALFKDDEFKFMIEIPEGCVVYDAVYSGRYGNILQKGGLKWVIDKVKDGWHISEIADYCEVESNILKKFIELNTGVCSMNEFKKRYGGSYIRCLK